MLSKTQTVMTKSEIDLGPNCVPFEAVLEDGKTVYRFALIRTEDWVEMGAPLEITMTVEAGDTLNKEET